MRPSASQDGDASRQFKRRDCRYCERQARFWFLFARIHPAPKLLWTTAQKSDATSTNLIVLLLPCQTLPRFISPIK